MRSFAWKGISWASVAMLASVALAQTPAPDSVSGAAAPTSIGQPITTYEQFGVGTTLKPLNLKFQHIYPQTELVSINNAGLTRNTDYTIDYANGILVILRQVTPGQIIRISYQHDPTGFGLVGPNGVQLPSSIIGAPTSPTAGGSPKTLANSSFGVLSFRGAASSGPLTTNNLLMFNGMGTPGSPGLGVDTFQNRAFSENWDTGHLIVQNLSTKAAHGLISVNYQDVSPTFLGFGNASTSADPGAVEQALREVGMKRMGLDMEGMNIGGTKLSDAFRMVSDGSGKISWESFALDNGPLKLSYNARQVGGTFTRFADLSESDRDTLLKEAGISRQEMAAQYGIKGSTFSFDSNQISDTTGQKIEKQDLHLDSKALKLDMGNQSVGQEFMDFASLTDDEQKAFQNEIGVGKKWLTLETAPMGKGGQPIKVSAEQLTSSSGSYQSGAASAGGKTWSFQVADTKAVSSFGVTANLPDAQVDQEVKTISSLYNANPAAPAAADRAAFISQTDLDRQGFRLTMQPLKTDLFDIEAVSLKGATDSANLESFTANTKNFNLTGDHEHVGTNFNEINELMSFEQTKLGVDQGYDKTDANLNWKLGGVKTLNGSYMDSTTPQGAASRGSLEYVDKRIDVSIADRSVSPGFSTAGNLPDPEAGMLAALNGFRDQIIQGKWQPSAKLTLQGVWEDQHNDNQNQDDYQHNVFLTWDPNKKTHLAYTYMDTKSDDPLAVLYENRISNLLFTQDFGKGGKLQYIHQDAEVVDPNNAAGPTTVGQQAAGPDPTMPQGQNSQDQLTYTATIDKNTSVQTQDTVEKFAQGGTEETTANTINRTLTPHFGISYTDLTESKPGTTADENKNNVGFWFDLAKGVRFSYGFVRDLNSSSGNQSDTTIGITPGNVGSMAIVGSSYNVNSFDNLHNQVTSNFSVKSSKPFNFGPLKAVQFNVGYATASDYEVYSQKNELANLSGKIGANSFMVEYKTQEDPTGHLGSDKFVSFQTDSNPKKWIEGSVKFKDREVPGSSPLAIRDFSITMRPVKNLSITNHMLTNPEEEFRPDVLMGSVTSPWRLNTYALDYKTSTSTSVGATWDERFDDTTRDYYRTAGVDVELFKNSGSPLTIWYGMEQGGGSTVSHQYAERFYLKYFEKPGPNQSLNLFAGNISYAYTNGAFFSKNDWTLFADYQYQFWTGFHEPQLGWKAPSKTP